MFYLELILISSNIYMIFPGLLNLAYHLCGM